MFVVITYDVNTESAAGKKRLRKAAKECVNYGQRVQNSVFECNLDPVMLKKLRNKLENIIDENKDSVRFYNLGNNWKNRVDVIGVSKGIDIEESLILI